MIVNKDLELYKIMQEALKRYLKAASLVSQEGFDLLSKQKGLLWSEISDQIEILEELIKEYRMEEPYPQIKESNLGIEEIAPQISEITFDENEGIISSKENELINKEEELNNNEYAAVSEEYEPISKEDGSVGKEGESVNKENGPANLFDKVVKFMKSQKCDELQWVRTYTMKYPYEDFADFQIKYFEHREPVHQGKNYLFFGDMKKNYTIRKSGDDILGDTSECFEIILNLSEVFDIDDAKKIS